MENRGEYAHRINPLKDQHWKRRHNHPGAKEKAEIGVQEEAMRAENVSKGVFITANDLPKNEPKIAERTA